jgi:hypothetical protein
MSLRVLYPYQHFFDIVEKLHDIGRLGSDTS